jgi:hypothetical protein
VAAGTIIVAGIEVPSVSPLFLAVVGFHVLAGIVAVIAGIVAMLSKKQPGRYPRFGIFYFWCLSAVFASATLLSLVRWAEDYHLFIWFRLRGPHCSPPPLDGLGQMAHLLDGPLIHPATDSLLCG